MRDLDFSTFALLEALPEPHVLLGADGVIVAANRAALESVDDGAEMAFGRGFESVLAAQDRAALRSALNRALESGARSSSVALHGRTARGEEVPWELTFSPIREGEFARGVLVRIRDLNAVERARIADRHELFAHCPDLVFEMRVTPEGRFIQETYNPATLRATGTELSQVQGHEPCEFLPEGAARVVTANYQRCLAEGRAINYETEIDFGLGLRSYHTFLVPFRDESGSIVRIAGFARDVTERRRAERALRESERRFSAAFHALPYSVSVSDLKTGRYLDCNAGFERISGYRREEVVGRTSHELNLWVDPGDRDEFVRRISETGQVRGMELRFRAKDGRVVVALAHCDVIEVEGIPCLLNTFEDVSERLRVNSALEAAEEGRRQADALLATAFRATPDAMAITDLERDTYLEVNPAFERIYGHARGEVVGRTPDALRIFADPAQRLQLKAELRRAGRVRDAEVRARRKDGTLIEVVGSAEVVQMGGRPCVLRVTRDVTEKRRAEAERALLEAQLRQAQKLEALGTLAGGIAHDFNNILMVSLNFADLALLDADKPTAVREHVEKIIAANTRARDLVRQILAFGRRQKQERHHASLVEIVQEALRLLQSTLPKSIRFETYFDPETPEILADPTQIHQVVMNLCTNAAHALGAQPGTIGLSVECVWATAAGAAPAQRWARLTVRDSGTGMSEETMRHIFDPFFTTKGPGEGTGLGLSVVHGIVNNHEGKIRVESTLGVGTTFRVDFPEHLLGTDHDVPVVLEAAAGHGEHVLLVDDEIELANSTRIGLERLGFRVTTCSDPEEAIARFAADPDAYQAVVTDLSMPRMNGLELARRLLARRARTPVILLSGHSDVWTSDKVRAEGLRELVDKPVSVDALARSIQRALKG